jgi:hypothetical protein
VAGARRGHLPDLAKLYLADTDLRPHKIAAPACQLMQVGAIRTGVQTMHGPFADTFHNLHHWLSGKDKFMSAVINA